MRWVDGVEEDVVDASLELLLEAFEVEEEEDEEVVELLLVEIREVGSCGFDRTL